MNFVTTKAAGYLTFWIGNEWKSLNLHFFPRKDYRFWGYQESYYDGPQHMFGLGRLILITWRWE